MKSKKKKISEHFFLDFRHFISFQVVNKTDGKIKIHKKHTKYLNSVHSIDIGLVKFLQGFSLELKCGSHQAGVRVPNFLDNSDSSRDFKFFQPMTIKL